MSIDKNTKQKVKELAGPNYTNQFSDFLIKHNAVNRNKNHYSLSHIRVYFSTETNNHALDVYFFEFWDKLTKEKDVIKKRIKKLQKKTREKLAQ